MTERIKIGIIGCGTVANYSHLPSLETHPGCELYAIADVNQDRLDFIGDHYHIPPARRFLDYHGLLSLPEIQGVGISTKIEQHYGAVMSAAMAGKHILCDRPLAATVSQGWEMVEAAKQHNVMLLVNLPVRIEESTRLVRKYIQEGKIGKVTAMRLIYLWYGPENDKRFGGSRSRRDYMMEEGGGPILDTGIHYFDLARVLAGSEFRDISAVGSWTEPGYSNPGHVICTCSFENDIIALIEESWVYTHNSKNKSVHHRVEVIGTEGMVSNFWDWDPEAQKSRDNKVQLFNGSEFIDTSVPLRDDFLSIYEYFTDMIRVNKYNPELASGEDGILAMESALKALESCRRNRYAGNEILREQSKYWVS